MSSNNDKLVQELTKIVNEKKEAIAKAEKPNWRTNCAFRYDKSSSSSINLQVCSDVLELTHIVGFLTQKKHFFEEGLKILGVKNKFEYLGYSYEDWVEDIKTRVNKIEITTKKRELELLEERLDKLISPELRAQMELEEIRKSLGV